MAIAEKYKGHQIVIDTDLIDLINQNTENNKRIVYTDGSLNNVQTIINANVGANNSLVHTSGNETINGIKTFTADIQGTCIRAKWADLAERYISDEPYLPGTLICFGGEKEITIATEVANGVVSSQPGLEINSELEDSLPVALTGRVPVRVKGVVHKFDKIVLSDVPGIGEVKNNSMSVIAVALESKTSEHVGCVLCATQMKL